ncbi:NmrA-like domain-containing protein [Xylaria cf. heliscus]|nr:NmrA-like domain-containing protein [Xylaria cf. heliscus]
MTGVQGDSVIDTLLKDTDIYIIHRVTRSPWSESAEALAAQGVSKMQADLNNARPFKELSQHRAAMPETVQTANITIAALGTDTLEHCIFSTLPDTSRIHVGLPLRK